VGRALQHGFDIMSVFLRIYFLAAVACIATWLATAIPDAAALDQGIVATVNDQPITSMDVESQWRLMQLLGARTDRKRALEDTINQIVKIDEAKRFRMEPSEQDIDNRIRDIAKNLNTDDKGLVGKLSKQGISMSLMRQYVTAQISFARLLKFKYKANVVADEAEVDRRFAKLKSETNAQMKKILADPRLRPVEIYSLLEIKFPVDAADGTLDQVLQSRAIEASTYVSRFKSCKDRTAAAAGIFNVQYGRSIDADSSRLPKPLKTLLDTKGPDHAYGPMRAGNAIQVVAFCAKRKIVPPKPQARLPTREQVSQLVVSEKFESVEQKYVSQMRKKAVIEIKSPALTP
jgi:peptidyl-prolyl cis-trans isomerase SurA